MVLVGLEGCCGAVLPVAEEDEFYAVEAKELRSELGSGIGYSVLALKHLNLGGVAQGKRQRLCIKRPGVDMRVNSKDGGRAVEERFGLLPVSAGGQELAADCIDVTVRDGGCTFLCGGGKELVEALCLVCESLICGVDYIWNILLHCGFHLFLVVCEPFFDRLFLASSKDYGSKEGQNG